ncbi:MAG: hypothetical protein AABX11_03060 [Nanoarchaeota archaeon]
MSIVKYRRGLTTADPLNGIDKSQLVREHPAYDHLSKQGKISCDKFANNYLKFLDDVRIAPDVVENIRREFLKQSPTNPERTMYTNQDGTAFALFSPGQATINSGMTIIYTHTDSPCLRAKVNPEFLEWDPNNKELHTGLEIKVMGYGGINNHQWVGTNLELQGWTVVDSKRIKLPKLKVYSPEVCAHTDKRAARDVSFREAHLQEELNLVTGFRDKNSFIKRLGLRTKEDFGRSAIYFTPTVKSEEIGNYYLTGYGHDDRVVVYAAVQSFFKSNPYHALLVLGFDKEECGSDGPGGANGMFFERVLNNILLKEGIAGRLEDITQAKKLEIFGKSLAIDGDVDVGATSKEIDLIDVHNSPRLGFGTFIYGGDGTFTADQISPYVVDYVYSSLKGRRILSQTVGVVLPADEASHTETMNGFFVRRGIPTINIGVPAGSLHSPTEIVHKGDLYETYRAYKAIIENSKTRRLEEVIQV